MTESRVSLRPLRSRLITFILIVIAGGVSSYIGFVYSVEIGGAILGATAGSLVTFVIQATQESEAWSREDQLFLAHEIYGPLNQVAIRLLEALRVGRVNGVYALTDSISTSKGSISGLGPYAENLSRLQKAVDSYWLNFADKQASTFAIEMNALIGRSDTEARKAWGFFNSSEFFNIVYSIYARQNTPGQGPTLLVREGGDLGSFKSVVMLGKAFHDSFMAEHQFPPSQWTENIVVGVRPDGNEEEAVDDRLDRLWSAVSAYEPYVRQVSKTKELLAQLETACNQAQSFTEDKVRAVFRP